jgi:DNA-binding NtrC family response regulator
MQPGGLSPLKILLIEREPVLREALAEALREAGHHLVDVATIERAREVLALHAIDIVVLDLIMREGTSESLLAEIAPDMTTVLTSADGTSRARETAGKYAVPFLLKPFDLDELLALLLRTHERRRASFGV